MPWNEGSRSGAVGWTAMDSLRGRAASIPAPVPLRVPCCREASMSEPVTPEWLDRVFHETKNWGRWGGDDERGALNFITPAKRAAAAALVRDGVIVSCVRDLALEPSPE